VLQLLGDIGNKRDIKIRLLGDTGNKRAEVQQKVEYSAGSVAQRSNFFNQSEASLMSYR
jgi:hypothetical protein